MNQSQCFRKTKNKELNLSRTQQRNTSQLLRFVQENETKRRNASLSFAGVKTRTEEEKTWTTCHFLGIWNREGSDGIGKLKKSEGNGVICEEDGVGFAEARSCFWELGSILRAF
ncbi:hypothetical protein ACLB2K_016835 [Fragaria x ananassa]